MRFHNPTYYEPAYIQLKAEEKRIYQDQKIGWWYNFHLWISEVLLAICLYGNH